MFDPMTLGILGLGWLVWNKRSDSLHGKLSPEREEMFNNAMEHLHDPERMRVLAKEFDKNGLKLQAQLLNKRADLRSRTPAVKKQHDELFERALRSDKPEGIARVAKAFEEMTATAVAAKLRARISELQKKAAEPAVETPVPVVEAAPAAKVVNGQNHVAKPAAEVITTTAEPAE